MNKAGSNEIQRGQAISFRIPSDTPDHIVRHLQKLKETERRNFSSKIAEFVLEGVSQSHSRERETVTIPLPKKLTKAQRSWLKHEHSEALIGNIIYHLLADPLRAATLLASLNSNSLDIDEALYLQEEIFPEKASKDHGAYTNNQLSAGAKEESAVAIEFNDLEDDLGSVDWETVKKETPREEEKKDEELDVEDLLGGFLAHMNK